MEKTPNKYESKFCNLTASGILEDAVDAIAAINQDILTASQKTDFKIADKMEVIAFIDWFYQNANTKELEQALLERWPQYPEMFHLASDYTLEGDLALADQSIGDMTPEQRRFFDKLMEYLWSFDATCYYNFWAGKTDYFETSIPEKAAFEDAKKAAYFKNVVKVWTVRVICFGGTILFRHALENGKYGICGFVCKKGNVGCIQPEGLRTSLYNGGAMTKEQLESLEFEMADLRDIH